MRFSQANGPLPSQKTVAPAESALYHAARLCVSLLARLFFRFRVVGVARVPNTGGVIVAANHASYFDIPFLGCALPRQTDYLAKRELFVLPLIGGLLRALGGLAVRRGQMDRQALAVAVEQLQSGRMLTLYPEGTRSLTGRLAPAKPGIGMLVAQSGALVLPVYIHGTYRIRPFRLVTIVFGAPISFQPEIEAAQREGMHSKKLYARIASRVIGEIEKLGEGTPLIGG